ncbi:MAG TPA: hypothetical protein ENH13_01075 [Euryarchaeota archaeon]|nr:hypothetical protein [Euryarchaeota archaeon]
MGKIPKVVNPGLYEKLKEFTIEFTGFLQSHYSLEDYKNSITGLRYVKGEKLPPYEFVKEDRLTSLMYNHFQEIKSVHSYEILVEFLRTKEKRIFWNEVFDFLQFYYSLTKEFKFDQGIFDLVYHKLEAYNFTKNRSSLFLSPLQNFEAESDEILLEGGIKIRRISYIEVYRIIQYSTLTTVGHPQNTKFTLERTHNYKESLDTWDETFDSRKDVLNIEHDFEMVATALRLFKKGDLGTPLKYFECPLDWGVSGGSGINYSSFAPFFAIGEQYKLTKDEIPKFQKFWESFRSKKISRKVRVALNRFNYLYERKNPVDNIIDCMIAMEALFGNKDRISMMVSLKTAFLLGKNENQVEEIFTYIRKAYDLRSDIVHGRKIRVPIKLKDKEYKDLREFSLKIQELLRLSLREYLDGDVNEEKRRCFDLLEMLEFTDGKDIIKRVLEFTKFKKSSI